MAKRRAKMFQIEVDKQKKLIQLRFSGQINPEHISINEEALMKELQQFEPGEVAVLVLAERMEPVSQENIPTITKAIYLLKAHARRIASVHKNVITRMQMGRIEAEPWKEEYKELPSIQRFRTEKEALEYLFGTESNPT
jgi:hypothetical protein